jgi:hypothetical protein
MSRVVLFFRLTGEDEETDGSSEKYRAKLTELGFVEDWIASERFMPLPSSVSHPMPIGTDISLPLLSDDEDENEVEVDFVVREIRYFPKIDVYWVCIYLPYDPSITPEMFVRYMNGPEWLTETQLDPELKTA